MCRKESRSPLISYWPSLPAGGEGLLLMVEPRRCSCNNKQKTECRNSGFSWSIAFKKSTVDTSRRISDGLASGSATGFSRFELNTPTVVRDAINKMHCAKACIYTGGQKNSPLVSHINTRTPQKLTFP